MLSISLLKILVNYAVSNNLLAGDGEDAFRDFMPDVPDNCVVFHEYKGDAPSPFIESVHRSVQIKVRNKSAEDARSLAVNLYKIFLSDSESLRINFSEKFWGQVYVRQTPYKLEQDTSGRVTYCFNLGITTNIIE